MEDFLEEAFADPGKTGKAVYGKCGENLRWRKWYPETTDSQKHQVVPRNKGARLAGHMEPNK